MTQLNALQAQVNALQTSLQNAGNLSPNLIGFNANLSAAMMDNYGRVDRELNILQAAQSANLAAFTLGGQFEADAIYQHTNVAGAFTNSVYAQAPATDASAISLSEARISPPHTSEENKRTRNPRNHPRQDRQARNRMVCHWRMPRMPLG
jgi:hypothetical protein